MWWKTLSLKKRAPPALMKTAIFSNVLKSWNSPERHRAISKSILSIFF